MSEKIETITVKGPADLLVVVAMDLEEVGRRSENHLYYVKDCGDPACIEIAVVPK